MSFRVIAPLTSRRNANVDPNPSTNPNQVPPPAQQARRGRRRPGQAVPQQPAN